MPPNTVWSAVSMLTVGPLGTVIVTLALAVAPSLSVTVKVRVTTWFAAVVPGAVQVASSTAASLNVPAVAVHAYVSIAPSESADVASSSIEAPPATSWSVCLDADRRVGTGDRDRDTSAAGGRWSVTVRVRVTTWWPPL